MGTKRNSVWPTYPYHVIKMGDDTYRAHHLATGEEGPSRATYREAEDDALDLRASLLEPKSCGMIPT
jgi:hypothetical protein